MCLKHCREFHTQKQKVDGWDVNIVQDKVDYYFKMVTII